MAVGEVQAGRRVNLRLRLEAVDGVEEPNGKEAMEGVGLERAKVTPELEWVERLVFSTTRTAAGAISKKPGKYPWGKMSREI